MEERATNRGALLSASRSSKSTVHSVVGTSVMPPSSPFGGRVRTSGPLEDGTGPDAVGGIGWTDQVVIDAMNDFDPSDLNGRASSELVADLVAPARVVKAGNTWAAAILASDPHEAGGRRVIFLSGDDPDAKAAVTALFEDAGFAAIDLGALSTGGKLQQVRGPLAGVNLVRL